MGANGSKVATNFNYYERGINDPVGLGSSMQFWSKVPSRAIFDMPNRVQVEGLFARHLDTVIGIRRMRPRQEENLLLSCTHPFILDGVLPSLETATNIHPAPQEMSLREVLDLNKDGLGEDLALFYSGQLLLAMDYIHQMGYVHCAIKPESILVCADGYLKLAGFGPPQVELQLMALSRFVPYVAPEIIAQEISPYEEPKYKWGVDYWSFGIVLMEMICNRMPFYPIKHNPLGSKEPQRGVKRSQSASPDTTRPSSSRFIDNETIETRYPGPETQEAALMLDPNYKAAKEALLQQNQGNNFLLRGSADKQNHLRNINNNELLASWIEIITRGTTVDIPQSMSRTARQIIRRTVLRDYRHRINTFEDIIKLRYFSDLDFDKLLSRSVNFQIMDTMRVEKGHARGPMPQDVKHTIALTIREAFVGNQHLAHRVGRYSMMGPQQHHSPLRNFKSPMNRAKATRPRSPSPAKAMSIPRTSELSPAGSPHTSCFTSEFVSTEAPSRSMSVPAPNASSSIAAVDGAAFVDAYEEMWMTQYMSSEDAGTSVGAEVSSPESVNSNEIRKSELDVNSPDARSSQAPSSTLTSQMSTVLPIEKAVVRFQQYYNPFSYPVRKTSQKPMPT